ncbi:MAG TPA: peptidoglycan-binding domain-containing protein [Gammaproteobacteria bacterium]|nr:peptidoglycan-binding domain-containing protein [Gammaproteobacteria bacterium]
MTVHTHRLGHFIFALLLTLGVGLSSVEAEAAVEGVALTGITFDSASRMTLSPEQQAALAAFEGFCSNNDREDLEALYTNVEVLVAQKLAEVGMGAVTGFSPDAADIDKMLDAVEEACDREEETDSFGFTKVIYAQCRMTMDGMTGQLDLKIPAGADGHMIAFDGTEGMRVNLTQRVQDVSGVVGQGWSSGVQWQSGPGETVERAGYPATLAQFEYTTGMGPGYGAALAASQQGAQGELSTEQYLQQMQGAGLDESQGLQVLSGMVSNKVTGWGYFSTAVPGIDIVQSFYRNFAESVSPSGDLGSFFGGMISSAVALLEHGIPLELHTTLETRVLGRTVIGGESMSGIYDVRLVSLPDDWCSRSFIDESRLTDIDAQMQELLSGNAPGGSGAASGTAAAGPTADPAAAGLGQMLGGLAAAVAGGAGSAGADMTAEEQAQMTPALGGLGGLFGGLAGGAAGMGAAAGAAAPAPASAASAGAAPARSGASLSSALMTDDLTESAQNMLQALGYDTGNTDGELSVETTIAISQFQAEQGLEVTGEVTPQLLGILAAAVDGL